MGPGSRATDSSALGSGIGIPIVGPLIGGVVGVFVYDFFIGGVLAARLARPPEEREPTPEVGRVPEEKRP
jgi:hypothetical protein